MGRSKSLARILDAQFERRQRLGLPEHFGNVSPEYSAAPPPPNTPAKQNEDVVRDAAEDNVVKASPLIPTHMTGEEHDVATPFP
jgi:hypothetical protein